MSDRAKPWLDTTWHVREDLDQRRGYLVANAKLAAAAPALARALCRVEWPEGYCGECGMERCYGHAPDCPLDAALTAAGLTTAEDREEVRCG